MNMSRRVLGGILGVAGTSLKVVFLKAACKGDSMVVAACLRAGINVDVRDDNSWTALHWAALYCHLGVVQLLVKHGANVNVYDEEGQTPLLFTDVLSGACSTEVAKFLRQHGATE